jgi:hypothetical protein
MLRQLLTSLRNRPRALAPDAVVAKARELLYASEPRQVIGLLTPILERDPDRLDALWLRGAAWLTLDDRAAARVDLEHAVNKGNTDPLLPVYLAEIHYKDGDVAKATALCHDALTLGDSMAARMLLATMQFGDDPYTNVLQRIHRHLRPRTYIEIGVLTGDTLVLCGPETLALGVDPAPKLLHELGKNHRVYRETSDGFFAAHDVIAELGGLPLELAFIDGMHHFEFALRDFMHLEKNCAPQSTILVHDCYPLDAESASRERTTDFWSGDIWRMIVLLKKVRPDLAISVVGTRPTGLGIIRNLDPASRVIDDNLDALCAEFLALDYSTIADCKPELLNLVPNDWEKIKVLLDSPPRA